MDAASLEHDRQKWETLSSEQLIDCSPWVQVFRQTVRLPSGREIDDYYRLSLPDFSMVIAVTPDRRFVAIRGYKHGIGRVNLSLPAGMVDEGEEPLDAARRELLEETGYTSETWSEVGSFVVDSNRRCAVMHLFLADRVVFTQPPRQDDTEELQTELLDAAALRRALLSGEIGNLGGAAGAAIALVLCQSREAK